MGGSIRRAADERDSPPWQRTIAGTQAPHRICFRRLWATFVSHFFIPLLEHHDRRIVEVFCYANVKHPDEITDRIKRSSDAWRNIVGL